MADIIDINVNKTVEDVTINVTEEVIQVNINTVTGGGGIESVTGTAVDNTDPLNPIVNISTLQEVLDNNHDLVDGNFFAGTDAGDGNISTNVIGIGSNAAIINEGNSVNALGQDSANGNTGSEVNALGSFAAFVNGGSNVNALGSFAGMSNAFSYVNLFGENAQADENGQTVLSKDGAIMARISTIDLTDTRKYNLPDADGTIALTSDIPDLTGYVPYTGATQDVNLGEFGLLTGNIEFDNTPTNLPTAAGSMYYNDTDGTVDLILKGGNVKLQIGQESVIRVVNKTATNINLLEANYQAVRVTGVQGQRLKVDLAQATTDILSAETIGLVTETINNNQEGFITTSGLVRNINTTGSLQGETWADGDILYLSPTTAGRITKVKPSAPNHLVVIGYVIHAHASQGSIFVKVDNGYELDELHNVKIDTPLNNQSLVYNSSLDVWENKTITIDATPTDGSSNAVSSNGVFDALAIRPKFIWKLTTPTTTLTGTNSETLMASVLIPANTLSANDILRVVTLMVKKTTATNTTSIRLRFNTTNSLSGATLLSTSQISGTNNFGNISRDFLINGGNISGLLNTGIAFTDKTQSTVGFSTNSINVANDIYLLVSLTNNTTSDVSNIECIEVMN